MKIIFEDPDQEDEEFTEKEKENKKEEESSDSDHNYFENRVDEEAFQRMCRDH